MIDRAHIDPNEADCIPPHVEMDPAVVWRWQERAAQWLCFPLGRFLDFGCGRGGLVAKVSYLCTEYHGVDVNPQAVEVARKDHPQHTFNAIDDSGRTPYPDDHFDTIALVEVIEHVPDERQTLNEIARILKPGGTFILTTPHKGWLTFLDLGNFKFVFPRLHKLIHVGILRNRKYYEERFVQSQEVGLMGDINATADRRAWHRHYKPGEIKSYCPPSLELIDHAVYFPAMRAFMGTQAVLRVCTGGYLKRNPWPISALERRISRIQSNTGDQLVMQFTKK